MSDPSTATRAPRLPDQVRAAIRLRHYSPKTEEAYVSSFLSDLAITRGSSASTQNQALSAVLFLYAVVLGQKLPWLDTIVRAQRPARLPVVLSRSEVSALLARMRGPVWIMASLMYGAGLRLQECVELRVKDLNFDRRELVVRDGKGGKDRITMLPDALRRPLEDHLQTMKTQHDEDLASGCGGVALPGDLRSKYPNAPFEWPWQWVFRATRHYVDSASGEKRRHHLHESVVRRAVKDAARAAGIARPATCHSLVRRPWPN